MLPIALPAIYRHQTSFTMDTRLYWPGWHNLEIMYIHTTTSSRPFEPSTQSNSEPLVTFRDLQMFRLADMTPDE